MFTTTLHTHNKKGRQQVNEKALVGVCKLYLVL